MAPKKPERRHSSKQPPSSRPTRPAVEGSLLQRKQDCIAAFKQAGSDRPTAAYNSLAELNADELQAKYDMHKTNTKKLGGALIRMCAANQISYTLDHFQRNKTKRTGGDAAHSSSGSARLQAADTQFVALDPAFWKVPVLAEPTSPDDGKTYKPSISLHDLESGERLLQHHLGQGKRVTGQLAIAVMGPKNDNYVGTEIAVPVLKRHPKAPKVVHTHVPVIVYQLGTKEVACTEKVAVATIDPADHVCWIRATIYEAEAIATVPSMHQAFEDQFSGGAPVNGGPRAKGPFRGDSAAQDKARQKHKDSKKDARRQELDGQLQDTFKALFHGNFKAVTILEPCKSLGRFGSGVGKRSLAATFGVSLQAVDKVLAGSGQLGATYDLSNVGADEPTADKYQTVWFPEDQPITMADAYQKSVELKALGVVRHGKSGLLGIRVLRGSAVAKAAAVGIRGSEATLAKTRYRITGIASRHATLTQIAKTLTGPTVKWDCEVYHTAWDPPTAAQFALVRAHRPPLTYTVQVAGCAIPWSIAEAPLAEVAPKKDNVTIVTPTTINEPATPPARGGGFSPATGTLLTKAAQSPYLHDLMTATPKGKGVAPLLSPKEEPLAKRHRSSSGKRDATPPARPPRGPGRSSSAPPHSTDGAAEPTAAAGPGGHDHGVSSGAAEGGINWDHAEGATATAAEVPGDVIDVEIISSGDEYSEDSHELFAPAADPPDAATIRIHHMEQQHELLATTVDNMQMQLAGVLSSQATLTEHVAGLEQGLATVVTQQQTATADAAALRGDIQTLLGQLTGGTIHLPQTATLQAKKEEATAAVESAAACSAPDQPGQVPGTGPPGADKGKDKGRATQDPY